MSTVPVPPTRPKGVQPHDALPPMPPQAIPPPSAPDLSALLRGALPPQPGLPPHAGRHPVVKSARPTSEQIDERCWTFTKQTNARRALGREPQTTMYCYLNLRNVIADLVPVPGAPNAFLARDAPPGSPAAAELELKVKERLASKRDPQVGANATEQKTPEYHWPWLDGRYLYIATGRSNIARHMTEMGGAAATESEESGAATPALVKPTNESPPTAAAATTTATTGLDPTKQSSPRPRRRSLPPTLDQGHLGAWDMLKRIEDRVEKAEADRMKPGKREEVMMRKALGFEAADSERLISLSEAYSSGLHRLHAHVVRIYSPGLKNLARLPETLTDGTQASMLDTVTTRLTDGSAFRLVGRMWDSLGNVYAQLEERRKRRGESGEGGPFGGMQPPVPGGPGAAPPPPPPAGFPPAAGV